jgi:hypothetical protein
MARRHKNTVQKCRLRGETSPSPRIMQGLVTSGRCCGTGENSRRDANEEGPPPYISGWAGANPLHS